MRRMAFGQESRFRLRVEYLEPSDIRLGAHWVGQVWAGVAEFQLQAHGFGWNQNVREKRSPHQPQACERAGWRLRPQVCGVLQTSKECVLCTDFAVIQEDSGLPGASSIRDSPEGPLRGRRRDSTFDNRRLWVIVCRSRRWIANLICQRYRLHGSIASYFLRRLPRESFRGSPRMDDAPAGRYLPDTAKSVQSTHSLRFARPRNLRSKSPSSPFAGLGLMR